MKQIDKIKNGILNAFKNSVFFFNNSLFWYKIYLNKKNIRKKVIIKRTKDIKIFNSLNKIYHITDQMSKVSRRKNKKIRIKGSTIAQVLFAGMFYREKSINQIMENTKEYLYKYRDIKKIQLSMYNRFIKIINKY